VQKKAGPSGLFYARFAASMVAAARSGDKGTLGYLILRSDELLAWRQRTITLICAGKGLGYSAAIRLCAHDEGTRHLLSEKIYSALA
jgi:hypothetical protein